MCILNSRASTTEIIKRSIIDVLKEEIKWNRIKCPIITREYKKG